MLAPLARRSDRFVELTAHLLPTEDALSTLGEMARIDVPDGPGGDAEMIWKLRPEMAGMVERMISTVYGRSILAAEEREVARMRIAQLNDCAACAVFRAPSVVAAGVGEDAYEHLHEYRTYPGYTERQRLAIEYAERFAVDHHGIDDELFARLRSRFADDEILDLTLCVAVYLGLGRTLEVLGVRGSGEQVRGQFGNPSESRAERSKHATEVTGIGTQL